MNSSSLENNLVEYILYLWQMEDIIRAFNFDIDAIEKNYVNPTVQDEVLARRETTKIQMLAIQMHEEKVVKKGHPERTLRYMAELESLHQLILNEAQDKDYLAIHKKAIPFIEDFIKNKSGNPKMPHTEACLSIMYGLLMLRLQKAEISQDTQVAAEVTRKQLAFLASYYNKLKDQ